MNRIDFMIRLSAMLSDLPTAEREEAIQYYEDYLNDAGVENEEEVLAALGTPEELAASIREGLQEGNEQQGEFSEKGFSGKDGRLKNEVARRDAGKEQESVKADAKFEERADRGAQGAGDDTGKKGGTRADGHEKAGGGNGQNGFGAGSGFGSGDARQTAGKSTEGERDGQRQAGYGPSYGAHRPGRREGTLHDRYRGRQKGNMSALFILLAVLAAPVVIPLVFALGVVVLVMIFVVVLLAGIFLLTGVICVVAGIGALIEAFAKLFLYPAGAVLIIGISLIVIGFGILFTLAVGGLIGKVLPKMFRGLANGIGGLFHRKGGRMA